MKLTPVAKSESGRSPIKNNIIRTLDIHAKMPRNVENRTCTYKNTIFLRCTLSLSREIEDKDTY